MGAKEVFPGKVALQQRVLPDYRVAFVDLLAESCRAGLHVYAGQPTRGEGIRSAQRVMRAEWRRADNRYLGRGPLRFLRQPGLTDWLNELKPDALILESNPRYVDNWRAAARMRQVGRPVIGWGLGVPSRAGLAGMLIGAVWRRWLARLDAVLAYSSAGAAEYIAAGFPAGRVFVAVNSVIGPPESAPERQSASGRPLRILFVGRLQERKRLGDLFRALGEVGIPAEIRIVGDGPALPLFQRQAQRLSQEIEFVGRQFGQELQAHYAWADLFALPGTGGLAVQQAMASGLPVIVAEGDGTQADLVTSANGWLVPPGDESALAKAIQEAAGSPDGLLEMGRESFRIVKDRANIEAMRDVFIRALNAVAAEA